jgi:hypothetical protein
MYRLAGLCLLWFSGVAASQVNFDIHWTPVAQVRSNQPEIAPVVKPVATKVPKDPANVRVERVVASPSVVPTAVGKTVCLTQLDIATFDRQGGRRSGVPLVVDMRRDQLEHATVTTRNQDFCLRLDRAGEYAVRFTSQWAASDGTFRGAQVFIRAS